MVEGHFGRRLKEVRAIDFGCHEGFYAVAIARAGVKEVLGSPRRIGNALTGE